MAQHVDFSQVVLRSDTSVYLEQRMAYDGSGNLEYLGLARVPNNSTSKENWLIAKFSYDGSDRITRQQVPDFGPKYAYSWDDRATYFS